MIKFDVFYDRGYSEYSSIKEKLRKDFLEDVLPKNILKGWVGVKNRNGVERCLKHFPEHLFVSANVNTVRT